MRGCALLLSLALAASAAAQTAAAPGEPAKDWELEIAPYGWLSLAHGRVQTTRFGNETFSINAEDVLESLNLAAFGTTKLRWRRFVGYVDLAWADIGTSNGLGGGNVRYDVEEKVGWLEALGGYRVYQRPGNLFGISAPDDRRVFAIDALAGLTYTWVKLELDLSRDPLAQVPAQERHLRRQNDWVAPYLALRFQNDFTESVRWETLLGVGSFGAGDAPHLSWQVTSTLAWSFTQHFFVSGGFRGLGSHDTHLDLVYYGPMLGAGVRF